jgi:hypothetical protein
MNRGTPAWDQLSTDSAQLLLCDLQPEIVARSKTIHRDALSKSAGVLLEIAKVFSLPTALSTPAPSATKYWSPWTFVTGCPSERNWQGYARSKRTEQSLPQSSQLQPSSRQISQRI